MEFEIKNRFTGAVQATAEIECDKSVSYSVKLGLAVRRAFKGGADLSGADLRGANLRCADLSGANLSGANLSRANLSRANLRSADLRNVLLRSADLNDASLRSADLNSADLQSADLNDADLSRANLSRANLNDANLSRANLRDANLRDTNLDDADLSDVNLRGAYLRGANLIDTYLSRAVLHKFKSDFWMILHGAQAEVPGLIAALKAGRIDGSTYTGECACLVGTIANIRGVDASNLERDEDRPAEQWFAMIHKGDKPGDDSGGGFAASKALEWAEEYCSLTGIVLDTDKTVEH